MLYAILCYNDEATVFSWTKEEDDAVMGRLNVVHEKWEKAGKLKPSLRLLPTSAATTLRKKDNEVLDGPYAETKEQLLGFYIIEVDDLEEGLSFARELTAANPGGAYELRPIMLYNPGAPLEPRWMTDLAWIDAALVSRAAPGGGGVAALFPRSRSGRGSVSGRVPARAEELAAERPAARSRRVADHGRPQRRDRRHPPPRQANRRCRTRIKISDLSDVEADRPCSASTRPIIATTCCGLLFICCHPDLPATQQVALALRIVSGLTVPQIARAFLVGESAMEQRITRAKAKVAGAGVPFEAPDAVERAERLASVAAMIYLVFNEGYSAADPASDRASLCDEAIRLARLLLRMYPAEPEIMGLLALMLLQHARIAARFDAEGNGDSARRPGSQTLEAPLIQEGLGADRQSHARAQARPVSNSSRDRRPSSHAPMRRLKPIGPRSMRFTQALEQHTPSPVVTLNRSVAVVETARPASRARSDRAARGAARTAISIFTACAASFLMQLGRNAEARDAFNRAIALANTPAEAAHIRQHLDTLAAGAAQKIVG